MTAIKRILSFFVLIIPITAGIAQADDTKATFDIVGIRLGMTEAQVMSALKAFDPTLKIVKMDNYFNYSDGANLLKTKPAIGKIMATTPQGRELNIYFSSLPSAQRVIAVQRRDVNYPNPPTRQQFVDALTKKHGLAPAVANFHVIWDQPGKAQCMRTSPKENALHLSLETPILPNLQRNAKLNKNMPTDFSKCGAVAVYQPSGDPVNGFIGWVADIGAWAAAEQATEGWLDGLEAEAIKTRTSKGQVPKL